ncbi:MAG: HlyD family efflux transporter periplasmic adaptor subunit [Fibrobacterota bacterium]
MKIRFTNTSTNTSERKNGVNVVYSAAKRSFPRIRWFIIVGIVISPLLFFLGMILLNTLYIENTGYIHAPHTHIFAIEEGKVEQVFYDEFTPIDSGAQIVSFSPHSSQIYQEPPISLPSSSEREDENIQVLKERIAREEREADRAYTKLENMRQLMQRGAATSREVDAARRVYMGHRNTLQSLLREYTSARRKNTNTEDEDISSETGSHRYTEPYTAPWKGRIIKQHAEPGDWVHRLERLVTVQKTPAEYTIRLSIEPQQLSHIEENTIMTLSSETGTDIQAKVISLDSYIPKKEQEDRPYFFEASQNITIFLEPTDSLPEQLRIIGLPMTSRNPRFSLLYKLRGFHRKNIAPLFTF